MLLTEIANFPVSTDTRILKPGDVFLALQGPNFDGHKFIEVAEAKGAIAAVVSKIVPAKIPLIKVDDTLETLMQLALWHRQKFVIPVIALTGSCGKTTAKEMLAAIFSACGETLFTAENLNNNIGVAQALLKLLPKHKYAIIEMGSSAFGEIARSTKAVCPTIAIITNAEPAHLAGFGDLDGVAKEKGCILHHSQCAFAILNADDPYFSYWSNLTTANIISFGIKNHADVTAKDIVMDDANGKTSFHLIAPKGEAFVTIPILGQHNVMNALAAADAAVSADLPMLAIKQGLENFKPIAHRLVKKVGINGSTIIDDSYSGIFSAMEAALKILSLASGEKLFITADMGELGTSAEYYHHALGLKAKEFGVNKLFALGNLTRLTVETFGNGGKFFHDREELLQEVKKMLSPNVTVLVKGSNVNKLWELVDCLVATTKEK